MAIVITVTPATQASEANILNVTGLAAGSAVVTFRRVHSGIIEEIPGSFLATASGTVTYSDFLYPFDVPVTYQVYDSTGVTLLASSSPTPAVPSTGRPWIRDLIFPALRYSAVTIVDVTGRTRAGRISSYFVTAQPYAMTVGDVRSGSTGTLQLYCRSHAERDAVIYAMSSGNPCSLRIPKDCQSVVDEMLFAPIDIAETRIGTAGACVLTVDFIEVSLAEVATFQPVTYATQTQNAIATDLRYGSLLPSPSGLSLAFFGKTYADLYLSPTGIAP